MIWIWLAVVASFVWSHYLSYGSKVERINLLRMQNEFSRLLSLFEKEMHNKFHEIEGELKITKERIGYEELDRELGRAIIWGEHRERALRSAFPRIRNLETGIQMLEHKIESVIEVNKLRD